MLIHLDIENIAVIQKVSIGFDKGFHALTGETGAGKSIIIDALNAVLGFRTSRDLVRTGANHALVIAEFSEPSAAVNAYLESIDIDLGCDNLILQRRIGADGKSSCRINGKPVTAGTMKELGELLVNIHGQHDSQKLLDSERHYLYLDEMLADTSCLRDYRAAYSELVKTLKALKALQTDEAEKQRRMEQLRYEIDEIEKAEIYEGEKQKLAQEKAVITSLAALTDILAAAEQGIAGDDDAQGAADIVNSVLSRVESEGEKLPELKEQLLTAADALACAREEIRAKQAELNFSPNRLDEVEERLGIYYDFANKYGRTEADILAYLDTAKAELKSKVHADEEKAKLEERFASQKDATYRLALALSEQRHKSAKIFEQKVEKELHFLNMPDARFQVDFKSGALGKNGMDEIAFLICVNAGENLKPLASVASGGELSRIMLAFRAVLGEKEAVPTLIFDEIDTGISGRAAGKVGLKLKEVSRNAQVICVTHLAQIAAMASTHYLIHKQVADGRTYTNVQPLDFEGRQYEIARLMGGMNINELMLENAKQLLKEFEDDNI